MTTPAPPYRPIDCSLHDRLESAATLRQVVSIEFLGPQSERLHVEDRITDVVSRDGAEWVKLAQGMEIRLDAIVELDGVPFSAGPHR
jgi:Rho-binding antiterminator